MDETERAFSLKLRPSATLKNKNFTWQKNFGFWKDKSGVRLRQKMVRNKQLRASNGGATAVRVVTLFVENYTWCQLRTETDSFDSRHSPTASQHVPLTSPLNTTLGFSCDASFRFCPPPCWSRWRWRVVSEQLITAMGPSAFPINYAAVIWLYTVCQFLTMSGWNSNPSRLWSLSRIKQRESESATVDLHHGPAFNSIYHETAQTERHHPFTNQAAGSPSTDYSHLFQNDFS